MRAPAHRPGSGFTLVEIMVVVVVIGLLAAMAIPAFKRVQQRSLASRVANDFRQFEAAFQRYSLETGQWPTAAVGSIPAGMSGYLPPSYTQPSPAGGTYGWSGPSHTIVLLNVTAPATVMQRVDAILDDGSLTSGEFTVGTPGRYFWRMR